MQSYFALRNWAKSLSNCGIVESSSLAIDCASTSLIGSFTLYLVQRFRIACNYRTTRRSVLCRSLKSNTLFSAGCSDSYTLFGTLILFFVIFMRRNCHTAALTSHIEYQSDEKCITLNRDKESIIVTSVFQLFLLGTRYTGPSGKTTCLSHMQIVAMKP